MVLGDWGGMPVPPFTLPGQVAAAAGMGVVAEKLQAKAVLALGDNFYTQGIRGDDVTDRFEHTFEDVYTAKSLVDIPWYVLAGNHDHYGNVSAELAYTAESERWNFPDYYHSTSFSTAGDSATGEGKVTVDVVMIDTIDLSGISTVMDEEDPRYFDPLPPRMRSEAATQWDWIEQQLAASTAMYLVVAGHFPVYSVCEHGNTQNLIDNLKPLLFKYGATAYLSGHDHCMSSVWESNSADSAPKDLEPGAYSSTGVQYMVSGMGDTCCYKSSNKDSIPEGTLEWYIALDTREKGTSGGFSSITATAEGLTSVYYDQDGKVLYTAPTLPPRTPTTAKRASAQDGTKNS